MPRQYWFNTFFRMFFCSTLLTVSGCAVGPDYMSPALNAPKRWANAQGEKQSYNLNLHQWWKRLGDPVLNRLIEEAVQSNLDVASALVKIREARSIRDRETGGLFPSVDGASSITRQKTAENVRGGNSIQTSYRGVLDASWEIDLFGGQRRTLEAAVYGERAAEEELRLVMQTLIADVAATYVEARNYQAQIHLARQTAAAQRDTASLIRTQYNAGSASAMDLAKADASASSTEANIPTYQASFSRSVHRLSILLGQEPTYLSGLMSRSKPIPSPRSLLPKAIPAVVLESRPDIRKAKYSLAQANANIGVAVANRYPKVSLTGDISTATVRFGDIGKSSTIGWSLGPSVSVPIFNAGRLRAGVDIAEAQHDQAEIAFRQAVLTALEDVENALVSFTQERIRQGHLLNAAQKQREATRLARSLYQNGSTSFLEVLDAERSLYAAETSLLQSRSALAVNYVTLAKALGGGWDGGVK